MIVTPNSQHVAFRSALIDCMRKHGETMQAEELLAVASHLVGQLVAMQDQRVWTSQKVMALVARNIEQGNREVIDGLLNSTGGTA